MKKTDQTVTASKLKWIFIGSILGMVVLGVAGVWYLNNTLASKVAATNDAVQSSEASKLNLQLAQNLKTYLSVHKDEVDKAAMIVAQTTSYRYQNQIVEDINRYAKAAGVSIIGFSFPQDISSATVDKTTGLKSLTATIMLSDRSSYANYLLFLKYIEQNLTKMQITDITLTPNASDRNYINDTSVGIQVYVQ